MKNPEYLFHEVDSFSVTRHQLERASQAISQMDANRLLNSSVDDLTNYFVQEFSVNVPVLHEDNIVADQNEVKIDVRGDQSRYIRDRSRPFYLDGTKIEISVPFEGDDAAFQIQPSTHTSVLPRGRVHKSNLTITIEGVDLESSSVKAEINKEIESIKQYLEWLRSDMEKLHTQLKSTVLSNINGRREKLLKDQNLAADLGFPLKKRDDSITETYVAPQIQRKLKPSLPPASNEPYVPEPVLDSPDYDHIIQVLENTALVMERSPSAFESLDEESLRMHFLVQLNGHYEGGATGETFNCEGKTDILLRVDGKNIFIGECKFWGGPKKYTETIDQLLNYTSWRDTKTAILIFNRQKNFSNVIDSISETTVTHPNFKRDLGKISETGFRYVFGNRDDSNRELILTVIAFDVPTGSA